MTVSLALFWGSLGVIAYTLIVFPLGVAVRALLFPKSIRTGESTPPVSVIIAAYNEEKCIGRRIENLLECDYPVDKMEILVASDGSTDATVDVVSQFAGHGVRLLDLPRGGKFRALNSAAAVATGDVFVFTDANTQFTKSTLKALIGPFADPLVGGVAGNQIYLRDKKKSLTADGECTYWSLDRRLKEYESRGGSTISATGAVYAIRSCLYQDIPDGVTDDFYVSTGVIQQGYRLVFAGDAQAFEPVAVAGEVEFGRKVRVLTRGLRAIQHRRGLLNPFRHGFYSCQLLTHKVLRRLLVFPLLGVWLASVLLWQHGVLYQAAALGFSSVVICALLGWLLRERKLGQQRLFTLPYYVCMVNLAAAIAAFNSIIGRKFGRWEPKRLETVGAGAAKGPQASQINATGHGGGPSTELALINNETNPFN